jgi:hypothetical protein
VILTTKLHGGAAYICMALSAASKKQGAQLACLLSVISCDWPLLHVHCCLN